MWFLEILWSLFISYVLSLAAFAHIACLVWWLARRARLIELIPAVHVNSVLDRDRCFAVVGDMELASSACAMTGVAATLFGVLMGESTPWPVKAPYAGTIAGVFLAILLGAKERRWRQLISDRVGDTQLDSLIATLAQSANFLSETLAAMENARREIFQTGRTFEIATEQLRNTAVALGDTLPSAISELRGAVSELPAQLQSSVLKQPRRNCMQQPN